MRPAHSLTQPSVAGRIVLGEALGWPVGPGLCVACRCSSWTKKPSDPAATGQVTTSVVTGPHVDPGAGGSRSANTPSNGEPARRLGRGGFRSAEGMRTWQSIELTEGARRLRLTPGARATRSWCGRQALPKVTGTDLSSTKATVATPFRLHISGDSRYRPWLREIVDRMGPSTRLSSASAGCGTWACGSRPALAAPDGAGPLRRLPRIPVVTVRLHRRLRRRGVIESVRLGPPRRDRHPRLTV